MVIIQNYYKRMRLLLSLFAIIFITRAHQAGEGDASYGGQSNEGEQTTNRGMVDLMKTSSYGDGGINQSSVDQMSSNLRIAEESTPILMPQSTSGPSNGNQEANDQRAQVLEREKQDQHKDTSNHLRRLSQKEMAAQQQTQSVQPQNIFYLDDQYRAESISSRKSIKLGIFDQEYALDSRIPTQNSDNEQSNAKGRKIVKMGLAQNDGHRSRVSQGIIIRIEPDSQQQDNILRVYQEWKMRRQKPIQHKISFLQGSLPKSKQTIKTTSKEQNIWLYCLIATLALVIALPLLKALFRQQQQIGPNSIPIIKDNIPKSGTNQFATLFPMI